MENFDVADAIDFFYPELSPLKRLLLEHSTQVRDKALDILRTPGCRHLHLDERLVSDGAMLHDIGIIRCHAPKILCTGKEPYIAHGVIGAEMLREYAAHRGFSLEKYARICERHTGSGLSAANVRAQKLPIPIRDYLPETPEEMLICLADKFFSKSGDRKEKSIARIRSSMEKFGADSVNRFDSMCHFFKLRNPEEL